MTLGNVFVAPDATDQLHRLLVILTEPQAYRHKLAELKSLSETLAKKQDELEAEDARIEAAHKAANLDINAASLAMKASADKEAELVSRENALDVRAKAVETAEKSHREQSARRDAELKARETDVTAREALVRPKQDELARREKDLSTRAAALEAREAKAREYARALGG